MREFERFFTKNPSKVYSNNYSLFHGLRLDFIPQNHYNYICCMVHCCEESFFELFWAQQMQKVVRHLLHDLSNFLTGNLALSELYCVKKQETPFEKFAFIRDNCYKEREILKQLSLLHHTTPGNVTYIDLQAFLKDLGPVFISLLPSHGKFTLEDAQQSEALIKFDTAFLQRILLMTMLLESKFLENTSKPELNIHIIFEKDQLLCQIQSNVSLNLKAVDLTEVKAEDLSLAQIYEPMVRFYMSKYNGTFSHNTTHAEDSIINLAFPIVA